MRKAEEDNKKDENSLRGNCNDEGGTCHSSDRGQMRVAGVGWRV